MERRQISDGKWQQMGVLPGQTDPVAATAILKQWQRPATMYARRGPCFLSSLYLLSTIIRGTK